MGNTLKKRVISIVLNPFLNDSRVLKENRSIQKAGFDVTVVALHEKDLFENEIVQELPVYRVKLRSRRWPKSKIFQVFKYLEFLLRVTFKYRNKTDIVHCNDLNTLSIGFLIKKLSKSQIKIVYDAHEYETERNGLAGISKRLNKWLEKSLICYADQVITVSESIANEYSRLYLIKKPHLVLNCPVFSDITDKDYFRETLKIRPNQNIYLYQGGLSKGRGIDILLDAFSSFDDDNNVLVCMGYGPLEKHIQEQSRQHRTIFFHPAVLPDILLNYTASADYGISFIEDTCLSYRYCLPNKLFEYLMAGLPVLTSNLHEMKRLVDTQQLGVVAEENNVEGLITAIQASLELDYQDIKRNVEKARKHFCWEEQEKILLGLYRGL